MTSPINHAGPLGNAILVRLKMRLADDPALQRSQASFALLQLAGASAAFAQAMVVLLAENPALPSVQFRLGLNFGLCILLAVSCFAFTAKGRVAAGANMVAATMLVYDVIFSIGFSLRTTPAPAIVSLCLLGSVGLVVPPKRIFYWGILSALVLGFGQLVTPIWSFEPSSIAVATVLVFAVAFFALVLMEFRHSLLDGIYALQQQKAALIEANTELHRTLLERDELSEKLATTERLDAMGSMAGNIAHDFNNMLTVIRGYSDRIAADVEAASPRREEVEQLVQAVSRASNVSRDVLNFAAPIAFTFSPIDLTALLRRLTAQLEQTLHPKVTLAFTMPDESCMVHADPEQLQRVVVNLATNARDATAAGGTVHIELSATADRVYCRVTDQGRGVPMALRERIFEPFYTTKGTTGGGGLGLASSYAIVRQHRGYITVDDAPGGGAVFTVELPRITAGSARTDAHGAAQVERAAPVRGGNVLSGRSVLLVEDDEPLRRLMQRMLTRAGAAVHAIDNGADAIALLRDVAQEPDAKFDVVVTDLRLPVGNGAEVATAALQYPGPPAIVVVSGFLDDGTIADYAASGKLQFLSKPFSESQLLDAIDAAQSAESRVH